jgi:hypothetical protein
MNEYGWGIGIGILIIAASLGRALAALIRAHAARIDRGQPATESPQLGQTLEDTQRRLGELEERLDFTERLLAKQRDAERLASPKGQAT